MAEEQVVDQEATVAEGGDQGVAVTLGDLTKLLNIVDVASSRGAFRGAEMTEVGAVFDKLNAFLGAVAAQQQAAAEAAGEAESAQEEAATA